MSRASHPSNEALASLRQEISELRTRLASRTSDGLSTPDSPSLGSSPFSEDAAAIIEWRSKYDRLYESYRRLQKTNAGLEDKLLRVVDKFEGEKNQMARDLASQTQKLVEAKLTIQRLSDQNRELQSDLNLSINLLRNKPNSFVSPKIDGLPADVKSRVKNYIDGDHVKPRRDHFIQPKEGKKIRVAIPDNLPLLSDDSDVTEGGGNTDRVSAAILAKVLEERDKERRAEAKFCIDVGTQTHGWHLNPSSANSNNNSTSNSPQSSMSSSASASPPFSSNRSRQHMLSSSILLASVIHPPPPPPTTSSALQQIESTPKQYSHTVSSTSESRLRTSISNSSISSHHLSNILQRSATFSATQTDI